MANDGSFFNRARWRGLTRAPEIQINRNILDLPPVGSFPQIPNGIIQSPLEEAGISGIERTPASELVQSFRDTLRAPETIAPTPIAEEFARRGPEQITGRPEEFFETQRAGLKEALREEFFGGGGAFEQSQAAESAAGRLGSGVALRQLQQTVTEPFVRASQQIDRDILTSFLGERARVDEFNTQQQGQYLDRLADLRAKDSANAQEAQTANAKLRADFEQLVSVSALEEAGLLNDVQLAELEANIKVYEAALEDVQAMAELEEQRRRTQIEFFRTPIQGEPSPEFVQFGQEIGIEPFVDEEAIAAQSPADVAAGIPPGTRLAGPNNEVVVDAATGRSVGRIVQGRFIPNPGARF